MLNMLLYVSEIFLKIMFKYLKNEKFPLSPVILIGIQKLSHKIIKKSYN